MDYSPIWISLRTAAASTVITFVLGILAAWLCVGVKSKRKKAVLDGILTMPLVLPPTVAGFFLLYIFGAKRPVGEFIETVFGIKIAFSWVATVISATVVSFPLMYRSAKSGFEQIDQSMIDEAKMMGLSDFGILVYILVPCTLPSIISGTVLSLTRGLGEYGATAMLAGNIAGKTRTLPLAVYSAVAAGRMDEAWIYVVVILAVAFTAVFIMNCFGDRGGTVKL